MSTDSKQPSEDDDLFNFDDLFRAPSTGEPAVVTAPAVAQTVFAPAPAARTPVATAKPTATVKPAAATQPTPTNAQLPVVKAVAPKVAEAPTAKLAAPLAMPPSETRRASPLTLVAVGMAMLVNLALIGIVWRSMSGMDAALREVGDHVARASEPAAHEQIVKPQTWQALVIEAPTDGEAERALESAAADVRLGEFELARTRLYSLLSVIDRFDVKLRASLTSRAQVLIADTYREQADRVEHETAADAAQSGFMKLSQEPHK